MTAEECYDNFIKVYEAYRGAEFNEADTRVKIIDTIFKKCLNWKEASISREDHCDAGYIDYKFSHLGVPRLVVEAKKTGDYFEIPKDKNNRNYKISGVISSITNLMSALAQAKSYCDEIGCKYAVVANGFQFVLFTPIVIGSPWKESRCIVFSSLDDIKDNFSLFWNIFSFEQVVGGSLSSYLDRHRSKLQFKKVLHDVHGPDYTWARNELYRYINPIAEITFGEMLDEARAKILKQCYVHERTSHTQDEISAFFKDKLPHFSDSYGVRPVTESCDGAGEFQEHFSGKLTRNTSGSLIVLLGGVGAGKSTFIHRYYKFILSEVSKFLWFYVEFRVAPPRPDLIEGYIFKKIYEEWLSKYAKTFPTLHADVGFNEDDSEDERKDKIIKLFRFLRDDGCSTSVVIDNLDQHDITLQESIFLHAANLTDALKSIILVSIRENTFLMSTRLGVFDAYHIPKFHISAPDFLSLIVKRINFTVELLRSCETGLVGEIPAEDKVKIIQYLEVIKGSLLSTNKQAEQIVQFIDNISVGDMRSALRMFNNFIVSGNTNVAEIFEKKVKFGSYQIAFHQFIKSIMLGERRYYDHEKSSILNLFDFDTAISDSHLNSFRVLSYLNDRINSYSRIGAGFVDLNDLLNEAGTVGIGKDAIYDVLKRLVEFGLVELDNLSKDNLRSAAYAKITHSGRFYISNLCKQFVYLDTVLSDTPISDTETYDYILQNINVSQVPDRLRRAEIFSRYLKESEDREFKEYPEYTVSGFASSHFVDYIYKEFLIQQPIIHENYIKNQDR